MANWYSNSVQFETSADKITELKHFFEGMALKEAAERQGQIPLFVHVDNGYLFNIRWENGILYYNTKWNPNTEAILIIADYYKVDFIHSYHEPLMGLYGKVIYRKGVLCTLDLDESDFDCFGYDPKTRKWWFEGKPYETEEEILKLIRQRKYG